MKCTEKNSDKKKRSPKKKKKKLNLRNIDSLPTLLKMLVGKRIIHKGLQLQNYFSYFYCYYFNIFVFITIFLFLFFNFFLLKLYCIFI